MRTQTKFRHLGAIGLLCAALAMATGCSRIARVAGESEERTRAGKEEAAFAQPVAKRPLPDLSKSAPLHDALAYAFLANGEIEAAYREWRAAIERIPQAGALPDPKLDFGAKFASEGLKAFDIASLMAEFGQEIPGRGKRRARAEAALADARKAGEKFRAAKFRLQRQTADAYSRLALNLATDRLTSEALRLFGQTREVVLQRYRTGTDTALTEVRKLDVEILTQESELRALRIQRQGIAGELNGTLNRPTGAAFGEIALPAIRRVAAADAELFERAARNNPDLAAQRREIEAKGAAQVLANLEKRPDFEFRGGLEYLFTPPAEPAPALMPAAPMPKWEWSLGLGMTLPMLNRGRIRAAIAEAQAARQGAEAALRAAESDTLARLLVALAGIRDAERILQDYRERIVPETKHLLDIQLATYGSGGGELLDILDTQRVLVDYRKLLAQAESDRLRFLSVVEELCGEDLYDFIPGSGGAAEKAP